MRFRYIILMLSALLLLEAATGSQPSGLPAVPQGLPAQQSIALTKQRAQVAAEGDRLQNAVEKHHATCAHIGLPLPSGQTPGPEDEALKERCATEQATIDKEVRQYAADAAGYRKAVDVALTASAVANNAYPARVVLKGTVHLISGGQERTLTSSRVVELTSGARVTTAPHARAAFQLTAGNEFILGAETELMIQRAVHDADPSRRRLELKLTKGTLRWVSGGSGGQPQQGSVALGSSIVRLGAGDVQANVANDTSGYVAVFKGAAIIEEGKAGRTVSLKGQQIAKLSASGGFAQPTTIESGQVKPL